MNTLQHPDEAERLRALRSYGVLDSLPEPEFDDLTHLAAVICEAPMAAITLIDADRQWLKSRINIGLSETPRDVSFCSHTINQDDLMIVADTSTDERFSANPFVTDAPHIRFYAGMPLINEEGHALGALCVIDTTPRQIDAFQQDALRRLGRQAMKLLDGRLARDRVARHALDVSQAWYRQHFESSGDGILLLNANSGQLEAVNPAFCQLLGYSADEVLKWTLPESGVLTEPGGQVQIPVFEDNKYIDSKEVQVQTKSGHKIWVSLVTSAFSGNDRQFIECKIRDVSSQKDVAAAQEQFFTLSPDILCIFDKEARFERVSPAIKTVLNFSPEEVVGALAFDYIHPDDIATSKDALADIIQGVPVTNFVNRLRCRDGSYKSILWNAAPHGAHSYAAGRDITDRVLAEKSVRESQRFLQSTLDALGKHIAVLDEQGVIIAVNKAWRQFAEANGGTTISCGIGANYLSVCEPKYGEAAPEGQLVAEAIRKVMAGEELSFRLEYPCPSPQNERWFVAQVTRFSNEGQTRVVVSHDNITERKLVERTLWQSEKEFRAVFDNALDAIIITDSEDHFVEANAAACELYGVSREVLLGMYTRDFVPPDWDVAQANREFIEAGHQVNEIELILTDGTRKYVEYAATANFLPGRHLTALRDITSRRQAEAAVRASEERLRFVSDNARVGLVMVDRDRCYTYANSTYTEILGLGSVDLVGQHVADVLAPLYEEQIRPRLDRAFAGERVTYELHRPTPNETFHYIVRYEPTRIGDEVSHVVVVITDITERKLAEEALWDSEFRMAGIVNAAMDAIITIDGTQRIILFNPAAERMFGYDSGTVLGESIEVLIPERYRGAHGQHIRTFASTGMTSRKMGALGALSGLRADGEEFPVEASISQIEVAGQKLFTVILRDITERQRAEAALQRAKDELETRVEARTAEFQHANERLRVEASERRMAMDALRETAEAFRSTHDMLQLVMNHIPHAVFWKDRNSVFLGCNNRLAVDAGFEAPPDIIGRSDLDMPWAEYAEDYRADDAQVMETDAPKLNIVEPMVKADGSEIWLRTSKIPLHDSGNQVVGVLCSYEDITEQKKAESALQEARKEAEAANLAKSEFLSRMSHELRTPLNAILGFGQVLEKQELGPLAKESLEYILSGGRHLLDLINEILDIARVEAGRLELSLEPIALDDIIPEACALMQPLAAERHIRLRENASNFATTYVKADRQRLKQVLINVLANGIKYNREGGLVEVSCASSADGRVSISIRDTGPGISPHDLQKLFTPFERLNASSSEIEGTGLGLVLSQRLMTAMDGNIQVQSTPGAGTTFTLILAQAMAPEAQLQVSAPSVGEVEGLEQTGRSFTVLCIEDNPSNLRLLEVIFESRPEVTLLTAIQGTVGLDLARQHEPDLILLDLNLPDMHGKDVLARLQMSAITRDIPVVVVSADATSGQIQRLLQAGAKAYLTKPLNVSEVLQMVDAYLQAQPES